MERVGGIEPPSSAWKANIINHYTIPAFARRSELRRAMPAVTRVGEKSYVFNLSFLIL